MSTAVTPLLRELIRRFLFPGVRALTAVALTMAAGYVAVVLGRHKETVLPVVVLFAQDSSAAKSGAEEMDQGTQPGYRQRRGGVNGVLAETHTPGQFEPRPGGTGCLALGAAGVEITYKGSDPIETIKRQET